MDFGTPTREFTLKIALCNKKAAVAAAAESKLGTSESVLRVRSWLACACGRFAPVEMTCSRVADELCSEIPAKCEDAGALVEIVKIEQRYPKLVLQVTLIGYNMQKLLAAKEILQERQSVVGHLCERVITTASQAAVEVAPQVVEHKVRVALMKKLNADVEQKAREKGADFIVDVPEQR